MGAPGISYKTRLIVALVIITVIFAVLIGRLFFLQVVESQELQDRALSQWTRDTSLSAARGSIQDATGVVLAQSGTAYKVVIWPNNIDADERTRIATELSELLKMDYATVLSKVADTGKQEIVLARRVERETVDQITARKLGIGVGTAIDVKRYYPSGDLFSQLLGFTTVDGVGQSGLEQKYDKYLSGENGRMITETDRKGNPLAYGTQEVIEPVDGYSLVLTVDSVYQAALEQACAEALQVNNAATAQGILMNCKTGAVLAITTQPDYDPNDPPRHDAALLSAVTRNRVVADAYEPGSTFKLITLAAALDSGAIDENFSISCPGYHIVNGEKIRCWKSGGHGAQNLYQVAQNSCNPAFMAMAQAMGVNTFYDYIYAFGLGSSTGSGITGEASGIVTHEKYITENTLARIGFGQSIAVTPIQLVTAVSAAVNGGNLMQPYVLERIVANDGTVIEENAPTVVRRVISEQTSAKVRAIAETVVSEGSGKNAAVPGYRIGGKTGTAQKYENGAIAEGKLIASFIGFAPADDPEFVCLILVDEPQVGTIFGSTVAAPFVKQMMEETLRHAGYLPAGSEVPVEVPYLIDLTVQQAKDALKAAGLDAAYQDDPAELVIAQVPAAGQRASAGSDVLLYTASTSTDVSDAVEDIPEELVEVPDVLGMARLAASDALKKKGLSILIYPEDQSGEAIRQSPMAGEMVAEGTEVLVEFSSTNIGE
ncbi:MAG: PASTA domain-containing protein [Clostridiales bacterium]|nr:PASTA domain-containing protein [Clostridiales bacterium]